MSGLSEEGYGLSKLPEGTTVPAPELDYLPPEPKRKDLGIGLVGCGGITAHHLEAYKKLGLRVVALCDPDVEKAEMRRAVFCPDAQVYTDHEELLDHAGVDVVDAATHPEPRERIIRDSIEAGKHVLSQKPFVTDLDVGEELVAAAEAQGVKLAVNHNGRWAPHFAYMRRAVVSEIIGRLATVDCSLQWDHTWTEETPFNDIHHLVLYDFAIHWFDITACFFHDREPLSVAARVARHPAQTMKPPTLAHVIIDYPDGQATLSFNAHAIDGQQDTTVLCGETGTLRSSGPSLSDQAVTLHISGGVAQPVLQGTWFESGFAGTMGELLRAIEEDREPEHAAASSLRGLALCFAAIESAEPRGMPIAPGSVRRRAI